MWTKLVDIERVRAYGLRTLVGAPGVSPFSQVTYYKSERRIPEPCAKSAS